MDKIKTFVSKHPWQVGFIVVLGIIVFVSLSGVFSGGGEDATSYAGPSGPSDASVMANAQIRVAEIGAGAAAAAKATDKELALSALQNQVDLATINAGNSVDLATIAQETQMNRDMLDAHSTDLATTTSLQALMAQLDAETEQSSIASALQGLLSTNQTNIQLAGIKSTSDYQLANLESNTRLGEANIFSQRDVSLAGIASSERLGAAQLTYDYNVAMGQQVVDARGQEIAWDLGARQIDADRRANEISWDLGGRSVEAQYNLGIQQIASNERLGANQQLVDVTVAGMQPKTKRNPISIGLGGLGISF